MMTLPSVTLDSEAMAELLARFASTDALAVMLVGSRARGAAGPHSDVDLLRLASDEAGLEGDGSYLISDRLVVVSTLTPKWTEVIFDEPESACNYVIGLRTAQILVDRNRVAAQLQRRARDFVWNAEMQNKANAWAARALVGWIEEVHKGLEGLRRNDAGRLLHARFGMSWGLSTVVKVQRGVLLSSDNGHWDEINRAVGESSAWVRDRHLAFGVDDGRGKTPALRAQVQAGLRLYGTTAAMMDHVLPEPERGLIRATVTRIKQELDRLHDELT
jgi:predicted nucleotidyltransferase